MPDKRIIRVFLASPGDLAIERRAFKDQIDLLNLGFGKPEGPQPKTHRGQRATDGLPMM